MMVKRVWSMLSTLMFVVLVVTVSVSTICSTGCSTETGSTHDANDAFFVAFVSEDHQEAYLLSDPIPDIAFSEVKVEHDTTVYTISRKELGLGGIYFSDTLSLSIGLQYTMITNSPLGGCEGTFVIPDTANITQPADDDTVSLGSDVLVSWNKSDNASFYFLHYSFVGFDSTGMWLDYISGDTFTVDTSFAIPATFFNVDGAAYYEGLISLYPYHGSVPEAGATCNMQGSIKGFLYAEGEGDYV
ncbi:MAG: hypothetical protein QMD82_02740, partial [bacterium]|nr:hypothetical protein [bacterium]